MRLSRKTNTFENLEDCFIRLYMNSHPMVRSQKPKKRKSPPSKKTPFHSRDKDIIDSFIVEHMLLSDVM